MKIFFIKFKRGLKKIISISLLIGIVVSVFLYSGWILTQIDHARAFYFVYKGDKCYRKGELQEAINNYNYALSLYPGHTKARYNLGNIYVAYEDYNSAVTCYERALEFYPDYINARVNLGIVLAQEIVDVDRAISEYIKATNSKPLVIKIPYVFNNEPSIRQGKAAAYYNLGLAYKAKSLLSEPDSSSARYFLEKAAESYRKSLQIDNNNYDTHYNLALTLHLLGNYTEALEEYCKAINIKPLNYEAHYNFALLLRQKMKYKESIRELEKAGIILDAKGDGFKTRYIYLVLNEVSQKVVNQDEQPYEHFVEKMDETPARTDEITYLNGRVVATEQLDKAVFENMKKCNSCKIIELEKKKTAP